MQERSTASGLAGEASRSGLAGEASGPVLACTTGQGLAASTSHWALMPCAEESSWLSAECSKLSAAAGLGTEHSSSRGQRRAALPAANRAMLERQVRAPTILRRQQTGLRAMLNVSRSAVLDWPIQLATASNGSTLAGLGRPV